MRFIKALIKLNSNKILKGGFELLLVIVSIFVVSYAWFTETEENKTDNLTIKTKASRLLYISLDDGATWSTELSLNLDENFKFNNEVTGNGVKFYKAATKRDDGFPITFKEAVSGTDYLEFDLLFKANAALGVFLDSDSYLIPTTGTKAADLVGEMALKKSSYGNFSRDLIAGALRVSFTENDIVDGEYISNSNSALVWAPNKTYELLYNNGYYTFDINSSNTQDYRYIDSSNGFKYKHVENLKDTLNTDYANDNANGDPMITLIDPETNDGIRSVTVRIWVEGNDRETHDALTGGSFKLNINFMGILKTERTTRTNTFVMGNYIANYSEGMEYSIDYGNNWITYEENNSPSFSSGDVVYVRYAEDATYYAGPVTQLNF